MHRKPLIGQVLPQPLVVPATKQTPKVLPASKSAPVQLLSPDASPVSATVPAAQQPPVVRSQQILVSVPPDASPGDHIQAQSPDGQTLQFALPAGAVTGQEIPILYTPLATQQAAHAAPVPAQTQPVMMVDESSAGTSQTLQTASTMQSGALASQAMHGAAVQNALAAGASTAAGTAATSLQALHAMSDAAMQRDAVNKVMGEYSVMQNFDDSNDDAELAFAKAEQAKHAAEWEAAADMDAASAAEEVVNYKAWKRQSVLQDAALAKNELAQRMGEYTVAKSNAITVAGTDAAWKATVPGAVPAPAADPTLAMHTAVMADSVASGTGPIVATPIARM